MASYSAGVVYTKPIIHLSVGESGGYLLLKLINNSSRQNKENHNREGGLDTRS